MKSATAKDDSASATKSKVAPMPGGTLIRQLIAIRQVPSAKDLDRIMDRYARS